MERVKSIIFDWGGVLIEDPRPGVLKFCAEAFGVPQKEYTPVHDSFLDKFHLGAISEQEFWLSIGAELGRPLPEIRSFWYEAFRAAYVPKPEVFSLAAELHEKEYKTALLSNTELPAVGFYHEQNYNMFDVLVFSCVERIAKPQPEIYEITVNRLGSKAQQTVFIDDGLDYVRGAKDAGLHTILFKNIDQLKSELTELGIDLD
ncbi:MAG: HAD family phosphatase [Phycisphaerales bacterium]|nr:MAG: HAD family phosphatase [Phycisphaerales bacterium]